VVINGCDMVPPLLRCPSGEVVQKDKTRCVKWSAEQLTTERLLLVPLSVEHAAEMVDVLADPKLYEFTGGGAPSVDQLRARYARQAVGRSDDGSQAWFNWIVKLREVGATVGFVQATVESDGPQQIAEVAWVISPDHQRHGMASEATQAILSWLRSHGVDRFVAHIHPEHHASMGVARLQGLSPTQVVQDGEIRWES
jgi:RimJ/RimL family protein N-acetyltransferase